MALTALVLAMDIAAALARRCHPLGLLTRPVVRITVVAAVDVPGHGCGGVHGGREWLLTWPFYADS
jgi:hypothetical protein